MSIKRVLAYFEDKSKTITVKGRVIQSLSSKSHVSTMYYELLTDKPVTIIIRDSEVELNVPRTTDFNYSLFVCADQCAPDPDVPVDNTDAPPPLPPNHPTHTRPDAQQTNHTNVYRDPRCQYKKGDLVTLPVEEAPNGLINGIVGYTGIHDRMELTEICVDEENTSSFISRIRHTYEIPNFPDAKRQHDLKGFSLVVQAHMLIPRVPSGGDEYQHKTKVNSSSHKPNFSQTVSSAFSRILPGKDSSSNHSSQNKDPNCYIVDYSERQDDMIMCLQNGDPIMVVTDYGYLTGSYRLLLDLESELHVAMELDKFPPGHPGDWKTPDGVLYDKWLFDCRPGHGALVHISKCRIPNYSKPKEEMKVSDESTLQGLPNLFDNNNITITPYNESYPPLDTVKEMLGEKKGIQGHMNSCYMDSSLFGMFAFSSTFDPLFLKGQPTNSPGFETTSIQRYNHVREVLQTRIVFPLRKAKFVRADQIMMLRTELSNAGIIDGLLRNEKDPEEFLKVLLQHVLNAEPYLKLKQENQQVNEEYIYQIFSTKHANVTLPTVQYLLEHSFKEHKIILASAPHVLLLQMPRFGKDFKLYPRIFPSLQLSLDNLTSTTYGPKCIVCMDEAMHRCPECEDIKLYYYTNVFVYYCDKCVETVHYRRRDHKPTRLLLPKAAANLPPGKMELFAVLAIEKSHYVCFARCKGNWVMFDSMADRVGTNFGRNIPRVTELPELERWLTSPEKMLDWMASDRNDKSLKIPHYVDRITKDNYLCMYHSEQVSMF